MKKNSSMLAIVITLAMFSILLFTGCMNTPSDNSSKTESGFNYDLILQLPQSYVGEADNVVYESLDNFKTKTFSQTQTKGALSSVECIETIFYITIRHDGEDIMVSGKAIAKCKVTSVRETFNNYNIKVGSIVELEQDYYIMPQNEKDSLDMFESFGATFQKDSNGEIIGMKIDDGDYILKYNKGVEYMLKINHDVLPLEAGKSYTGAIVSYESRNTILYLAPTENTQRYEVFQMSQSQINLATEIMNEVIN